MNEYIYLSLGIYFLVMLGIGAFCYFRMEQGVAGFMLGGRKMGPAVTALSAGASDMSGWILMGLPGLIYATGLGGSWMAIGLTIGAYLNYRLLAPRLRWFTEKLDDAVTIPEYLERRFADNSHLLRIICSLVIILFFTIYTTSGFVAGGKLFESAFGMQYEIGLIVTAIVVVSYSTFGGFSAVSITDFVQGCIMLLALVVVPLVTLDNIGGWSGLTSTLTATNPDVLNLSNASLLTAISAASWGLGYFGQPHIIVRFMAINSIRDLGVARKIGISWMVVSILGTISVGLTGAAYIAHSGITLNDPETIFIVLSNTLFHPLVTGFLLAAILAAVMSTISSQLLVSSSSITEDVYYTFLRKNASQQERVLVARASVVGVALIAVAMAFDRSASILSLVGNAWAGFGAAFGPVILISLYWSGMTKAGALAGMSSGALTVLLWLYLPVTVNGQTLSGLVYEIIPGVLVASLATVVVSRLTAGSKQHEQVAARFSDIEQHIPAA